MARMGQMVGIHAPQFTGEPEDWINTNGKALKLEAGTVYLIDFWEYTCVNCLRTLPYVKEWHERYKDKGLMVVGIHTPEFEFAKDRENVEEAVERLGIDYPVLLDPDYVNWREYANSYWPRKYLVGPDGRIIYDHIGEGGYGETEYVIQETLKETNPGVALPRIMSPLRGADKPGAVCYPITPELYLGHKRGLMGNREGYQHDRVVDYADPGSYVDGRVYVNGPFYNGAEFLRHARNTETPDDYLAIRYHATEVNAVIRPVSGPFVIVVTQDGRPLPEQDAGEDVRLVGGQSLISVDEPRMYRIVANREFGSHELRLSTTSDSFAVYAFTFGSCEEPE